MSTPDGALPDPIVPRARLDDLALLLVVSVPFLFLKLGMPLLDPDEGLYAAIAQEMLSRSDWVIPHVNGLPYLEKPPLYFWLTAATMWLVGPTEWAVRVWSALAALGTVLLTWRIGRRLYGASAGFLAGIALATMIGNALYVRKASTDQLFVFCLTLAMYGFLRDVERPDRGGTRFLLLYVGAALGVLAKGFLGLMFPVLIVGIGLAWVRPLSLRELNPLRGAALMAAIAVPWHVLAARSSPTLFSFYLLDNHLLRFLNARRFVEDDVPISTLGFLVTSFLWAFPWGVFVLARSEPDPSPAARWRPVIVAWALAIVGLFALSQFKHEYYALPAFPALALLAGAAWASGRDIGRWLGIGMLVLPDPPRSGRPLSLRLTAPVQPALAGARADAARRLECRRALLGPRRAPPRLRVARRGRGRDHHPDLPAARCRRASPFREGDLAGDHRCGRSG